MGVDLDGDLSLRETLDDFAERWGKSDETWVVGTGVEYAIYLEFGTSKMDPKPFVRPAIQTIRSTIESIVDGAGSADEVVQRVALALEREIKEVITRKGLIDTGTLRASVMAIENGSPSVLPDADAIDPDATTDIEISA